MPGPPPKPPGQRRRRNAGPQFKVLPAEGRQEPVPELPDRPNGWLPSTREWWERIWKSPMATQWVEVEYWTLVRLARMIDLERRGEANTVIRREIRYLEDAFGLNPASRARLRWQIGPEAGAEMREVASFRRLRAVDPADGRWGAKLTLNALRRP